jgi:hypothetical protein
VPLLLILLAAAALAAVSYARLSGPGMVAAAASRAVAWAALGVLLLNPSCPVPGGSTRPLVLLDGSLSMRAAGGRWGEARALADSLGDLRLFGDPERAPDSMATAGRSVLGPALEGALAGGRPVWVITDGEVEDGAMLPAGAAQRARVRVLPRAAGPAVGMWSLEGPPRVAVTDTLRLRAVVRSRGTSLPGAVVTVALGSKELARRTIALQGDAATPVEFALAPGAVQPGDHVLSVGVGDSLDGERRDDRRLHLVTVSATPGIVLLGHQADWETRFLSKTLRETTRLPVLGLVRIENGWRRMTDLAPVAEAEVQRAVRRADLVVVRGRLPARPVARAVLEWPEGTDGEAGSPDWYLSVGAEGPIPGALTGQPIDSLPPATELVPLTVLPGDWVGLTAQAGRRGTPRPAVLGRTTAGGRTVVVGAQGLWRWAFRGGAAEAAYQSLVTSLVDWLLATPDTVAGVARPLVSVVPRGRPLLFEWAGGGVARPVAVAFDGTPGTRRDSLRFDGVGRAAVFLEPGIYTYRLDGGGAGTVAVEEWSEEWWPRPVTVTASSAGEPAQAPRRGLRDRWWLMALAVAGLCVEWTIRRRAGLR